MAANQGALTFAPRIIGQREQEQVQRTLRLFSELQTYRNVFAGQWEEAAVLILPTARNTFFYGSYNWPGMKKTQQQVDASGALALSQFCAIAESLITPKNDRWHGLRSDIYVMKDRATRLYFDQVTDILFDYRYRPLGNFHGQNFNNWQSLGAFGNSIMYIDEFDGRWSRTARGLRYRSVPLGECFFQENHQGIVNTMVRWFRRTARQAAEQWGEEWVPATLCPALEQDMQQPYNFLHCVRPRDDDDFDPERLDARGMPYESYYVSIEGQCLMAPESGYRVFPYAISRYDQTPGECYGRGPAQIVLPGLKTLNAEKSTFLTVGHRAANPVYLSSDDGITDFSQRPGAMNKGGVSADGKPLVHILPTGELQTTLEMMQEERGIIETTFLVSLFKTLTEHPNMTATQVIELLNERGMLVAPTLGRQHAEYVGAMVEREIDLLSHMRDAHGAPMLPPMPPRLREAMGEYQVTDTSPLAKAARANQAAGFIRTVETVKELVNITQDASLLDPFDFDTAIPEISQIQSVPERWMSNPDMIAAKRQQRARAAQQRQQIEAMPAQAAMLKAQAVVAKNQPGVAPGQAFGGPAPPQQALPAPQGAPA